MTNIKKLNKIDYTSAPQYLEAIFNYKLSLFFDLLNDPEISGYDRLNLISHALASVVIKDSGNQKNIASGLLELSNMLVKQLIEINITDGKIH